MTTAGVDGVGETKEGFKEDAGSESTISGQKHDGGKGGIAAGAVTKEREAGWGDYFR